MGNFYFYLMVFNLFTFLLNFVSYLINHSTVGIICGFISFLLTLDCAYEYDKER